MQLTPFQFEAHTVRTGAAEDGSVLFNGNDVCAALGFGNPSQALKSHVDLDDLQKLEVIDGMGRTQQANFLTEPGLYSLIMRSNKPEAKRFQRWVTSEVLPQIRKTGKYGGHPVPMSWPDALQLAADQARQLEAQKAQLEAQRPAVAFVETYMSDTDYVMSVRELAKVLRQKERALVKFLLAQKILIRNSRKRLEPYARTSHYCVIMPIKNKKTGHTGDQVMFNRAGQMHVASLLDNQRIQQPGLALRGGS